MDKANEKSFASGFKLHTDGNIGQTVPFCSPILITPEIVAQMAQDSRELGVAMYQRLLALWDVPPRERQVPCCPSACCPRKKCP
jgi:hypothetical protein